MKTATITPETTMEEAPLSTQTTTTTVGSTAVGTSEYGTAGPTASQGVNGSEGMRAGASWLLAGLFGVVVVVVG